VERGRRINSSLGGEEKKAQLGSGRPRRRRESTKRPSSGKRGEGDEREFLLSDHAGSKNRQAREEKHRAEEVRKEEREKEEGRRLTETVLDLEGGGEGEKKRGAVIGAFS